MLEPKFKRPGKPGHLWPGVYKVPQSYTSSPDMKKHPWRFNCPAPLCFYHGGYADEAMARKVQETHPCPWFGGGTTTLSWGIMSDMFLAPIWKKLDDAVDELMRIKSRTHDYDPDMRQQEGLCRGLAESLAVLMPPFFSTGDEIAQEAMVRYEKRQAGEDYETPGIGRLRYSVPPAAELLTPSGIPHAAVVGTKSAPEYHPANAVKNFGLSDETVAAIMSGHRAGFPDKMLALAHAVDEKIISRVIKANA